MTIEDILEEIVGEIEDEYDGGAAEDVVRLGGLLDARVSIDDLNELLGLHIEGEDFDTVGGFVYHELGRIPLAGDEVECGRAADCGCYPCWAAASRRSG